MTGVSADVPLNADPGKLNAAIAAAAAKVAGLNKSLSGLQMDADAKTLIAKISGLQALAARLANTMAHMEADVAGAGALGIELAGLQAQAAKLANTMANMPAGVDISAAILEMTVLRTRIDDIISELEDMPADIDIRAVADKIIAVTAQVDALKSELASLKLDADVTVKLNDLVVAEAALAALVKERDVLINADIGPALANIATLKAGVAALQQTVSRIHLNVDDAAGLATVAGFVAKVNALTKTVNNLTPKVDIAPAAAQFLALQAAVDVFTKKIVSSTPPATAALSNLGVAGLLTVGWLGALQGKTQLFAGVLTQLGLPAFIASASALHILADAALEVVAEVVPASIALAAFGIGAAPVIADIATQMRNVFTVSRALNQNIYPLTGGFQKLADAVRPEVYTLFGDALVVVEKNMGGLQTLAVATGKVVDQLALRITAALTSGSLNSLIAKGPADLAQLGSIIGNIFGIIGNVIKVLPGYAQQVFGALDAVTKAIEALSASALVQWLLGAGLAVHGFLLWTGLAVTAAVLLGNALLGLGAKFGLAAAGATVFDSTAFVFGLLTATTGVVELGGALVTLAGSEAIAAAATGAFNGVLDALGAVSPFVWIVAAIAGLTVLGLWLARGSSSISSFGTALNTVVTNSSITTFGTTIKTAIGQATTAVDLSAASLASLQTKLVNLPAGANTATAASGRFGAAMDHQSASVQGLSAQINTQSATLAQNRTELALLNTGQSNYSSLLKTAGGNLSLLNAAGITSSDVLTANKSKMAQLTIEVQAQVDAQKALSLGTGESAAGLNAMNIPLKENQQALQNMIQAESQLLGIITGGQTSFNSFQQSIQGTTAKFVSPSGLANAFALAGGNLTGLNQQSLAFSNTLYNISIPALQTMIGNLQRQGISQTNLTAAVATGVSQMLQFTGGNKEANSVLVALINNALGPTTVSLSTLKPWVDKNKTSMQGFSALVADSTVKASTLATTLNTDLVNAFQNSLFKASGAQAAIDLMTNAIVNGGTKSNAFKSARDQLIADLEKTGLSSQAAKSYVDNLQTSINNLHGKTGVSITTTAPSADQQVLDLTNNIIHLPSKAVSVRVVGSGSGAITATQNILGETTQKLGSLTFVAKGGKIGGHGSGDTVPAMLTPGEVVVPKGMVRAGAVDHLKGKLPGFAAGGLVGPGSVLDGGGQNLEASTGGSFYRNAANAEAPALMAAFLKNAQAAAAKIAAGTPVAYSKVAGVTQWEPDVAQVLSMLGLPQADLPTVMSQILTECVTLDTVILTRRGWLDYTEVQAGDETIGYNSETGHSEWTRIEGVIHYPQRETWRFGNKYWSVKCTPNHRWLTEQVVRRPAEQQQQSAACPECGVTGGKRGPFPSQHAIQIHRAREHAVAGDWGHGAATAEQITGTRLLPLQDIGLQDRVVLAREADTDTSLNITVNEASLLGWIAGDGWVSEPRDHWHDRKPEAARKLPDENAPFGYRRDGQPKKNHSGRPLATGPVHTVSPLTIGISQSKQEHFAAIDLACSTDLKHVRYPERPKRKPHHKPATVWRLSTAYSRDLLERAGNPKTDAVSQVLQMSTAQREAWLDAMIAAEGSRSATKTVIYQNDGPVADAIELAVYLSGNRPARTKAHNGWGISITAARVGGPSRNSFREPAGYQDVWCVTTGLGTWTARQEGHVFLTGNSGGNPNAINLSDSNAAAGDPSKGLMQVISGTFAAYRNPGLSSNIYDPLANIYAGVNYAIHRYGNPGWLGVLGHGHGYAAGGLVDGFASGGLVGSLAAGQSTERNSFAGVRSALAAAFAHPSAYVTSHKTSLAGELATLTKRQTTEQAAYAALAGKGLTSGNLSKFGTTLRSEALTDADKYLSTAVPGPSKGLAAALKALETVSAAGKAAVAKAAGATGATTTSAAGGAGQPKAGATTTARLGQQEKAEVGDFNAVVSALAAAFAHPSAYVTSHKTSLTGELATLTKRQGAEEAAYKLLAGKGLTAGNLSKFGTATRAETATANDKYLSTAVGTKVLAAALATLGASAAKGVIPSAAIAAANTSTTKTAGGTSKEGSAPTSILSEAQYTADFAAVQGLTLGEIRKSPHLTHLWHLLHLQHEADLGLAQGGAVSSSVAMVPRLVHDAGGWIPPGVSMSVNRTGQYERVTPPGGSGKLSPDALAIVAALQENTAAVQGQGTNFARSLNNIASNSATRGSYSNRR